MPGENKHPMSPTSAARIQSTQEKGGHDTGKGTFAANAQSAGDKNANTGIVPGHSPQGGGGGGDGGNGNGNNNNNDNNGAASGAEKK